MRRRCKRRRSVKLLIFSSICVIWSEHAVIVSHHHDNESSISSRRRSLSQPHLRGATTSKGSSRADSSSSLLPEASATLPLHATSGTHHAYLFIGSPPQRQTLIVDTGSRLMALPCQPCVNCGRHASSYFDPEKSTTDVISTCGKCALREISKCSEFNDRCIVTQKYTEGSSWHAYEMEDIVWLGTDSIQHTIDDKLVHLAVPYVFGCQTSETGLFRKQYADGILGMALHESSIVNALHDAGAIHRKAFSLCFTKDGGQLALGGTLPHTRHYEPMQFVPVDKENGFYNLRVMRVDVGNICITCGPHASALVSFTKGKGTILDSGTTDTYFPKAVAAGFAEAWTAITGLSHAATRMRFYSFAEFRNLPIVFITFEGNTTLVMKPENYMENVPMDEQQNDPTPKPWKGSRQLVNRIYVDEPAGAVLGVNAMIGYDMLFDVQQGRVGWARADCRMDDDAGTS